MTLAIATHNGLDSRLKIVDKPLEDLVDEDFENRLIDVVVSDAWFHTLSLPWDGLYFAYALASLRSFLKSDFACLPREGVLKGMCLSTRVGIADRGRGVVTLIEY